MDRGLLVPHEDMPDAILLDERVVERKHRAAGIAEQRIDPELGQLPEQFELIRTGGRYGLVVGFADLSANAAAAMAARIRQMPGVLTVEQRVIA